MSTSAGLLSQSTETKYGTQPDGSYLSPYATTIFYNPRDDFQVFMAAVHKRAQKIPMFANADMSNIHLIPEYLTPEVIVFERWVTNALGDAQTVIWQPQHMRALIDRGFQLVRCFTMRANGRADSTDSALETNGGDLEGPAAAGATANDITYFTLDDATAGLGFAELYMLDIICAVWFGTPPQTITAADAAAIVRRLKLFDFERELADYFADRNPLRCDELKAEARFHAKLVADSVHRLLNRATVIKAGANAACATAHSIICINAADGALWDILPACALAAYPRASYVMQWQLCAGSTLSDNQRAEQQTAAASELIAKLDIAVDGVPALVNNAPVSANDTPVGANDAPVSANDTSARTRDTLARLADTAVDVQCFIDMRAIGDCTVVSADVFLRTYGVTNRALNAIADVKNILTFLK